MVGRHCVVNGETCLWGDAGRSQRLHCTDAAMAVRSAEGKAVPREGRQDGGYAESSNRQSMSYLSPVPATAKQDYLRIGRMIDECG